jgi:hypothetical protein
MHTLIIFLASLFQEKSYSVMAKIMPLSVQGSDFSFNFFNCFFTNDEKTFAVFRQLPWEQGT